MEMAFLQETKIKKLDDKVVESLWGRDKMGWYGSDAEGASGGLVTIWEPEFIQPSRFERGRSFDLVHGKVVVNNQEISMNFLNVYAPKTEKEKMQLWEALVDLKVSFTGEWVVGGDFNAVLTEEERSRTTFSERDANAFNDFIQAMEILDIPFDRQKVHMGKQERG
ncbi:hypothetical protein QQ045_030792 [Rhodiola kirilowii]